MNGAESLVRTLLASGVDTCFTNPGTSEMHFVAALDTIPGMRCVLGLQENTVTGMAGGYHRIARKPASTLLHCGPGLANGIANLHNSRRAKTGVVNIIGDQATYHRPFDAPLTADTSALAGAVSAWLRTSTESAHVGRDAAEAVRAASTSPGQVASLILPADASWDDGGVVADPLPPIEPTALDPSQVDDAARILRGSGKTLLLLAADAVRPECQKLAYRIAQATGADLMGDYINGAMPRGQGRLQLERVPYSIDQAIKVLKPYDSIILVQAKAPVGFFAYPGKPSIEYRDDAQLHELCRLDQNAEDALQALVDALGAPDAAIPDPGPRLDAASGPVTPEAVAQTVAALMPDNAIVADESISFGRGFYANSHAAPAHDWLHLVGGAIGEGLPMAAGAAIGAGGERRVIGLQADGSAMYTVQALWTYAREKLPITTIILSNRQYKILIGEYANVGANPGPTAMDMLSLGNPDLDWVGIAGSMGVEGAKATTMEELADLMRSSFKQSGPFLIELEV